MSETNEVDGKSPHSWLNGADNKTGLKTIHFAHCVRSVAATHRKRHQKGGRLWPYRMSRYESLQFFN